ncbi:MAG TPA: translation elongation factor 4 [Dictyoglomaceae bacterium]|nr:translation elongation factor 4 [Dictyoglomaceae bacterium]HOL38712.1 translation elongation factor 4 [Dictyoglomaceae bacterium]HPP15539.1 translation elongation factor 4 [Dictyoglomaceae bacterium]
MKDISKIRNFSIIAHVDHGKSTLADRLLEYTEAIEKRKMREQLLDTLEIERERGITVKAQAVRFFYNSNGEKYEFNLIDTPGHVDFTYEVSRSLAACEGAILVVDATQGIEAQTINNLLLALENNITIIPVVNKIDLPNAEPEKTAEDIKELLGDKFIGEVFFVSAKEGWGIPELLEGIIKYIPSPEGKVKEPLQALIFDAKYDSYRGVIIYVRVFDGFVKSGDKIKLMSTGTEYEVQEVGVFIPDMVPIGKLEAGEVGYIVANIKNISEARVGDTVTNVENPAKEPLPGYKKVQPMVFCGIYPVENNDYENLRDVLQKLSLNDASLYYEPEKSPALGFGFRCGFLGLLHLEIVQERLEREFDLNVITTVPSVAYEIITKKGERVIVQNPLELPPLYEIEEFREPFVSANVISPSEYMGSIIELINSRRGTFQNIEYITPTRVLITCELPLSEIITEFFDVLKSVTRGYGSMSYEFLGYRPSDLVKLDVFINGKPVDALSIIVHRDKAYEEGRKLVQKLRDVIPKQLFEVVIQTGIGGRIIAREEIKPLRKNVLQKCYGGDVTRKKKLLEKQKEGKKRMKKIGQVEIPQEAFWAVLKRD